MARTRALPVAALLACAALRAALAQSTPRVFVHYLPWYDATGERYAPRTGWCYPHGASYDCSQPSVIHYSNAPLIGEYSQFDAHVLEYHFLAIFVTGIDGLILNINPANALQRELSLFVLDTLVSINAAFPTFHLKLIVSYDDGSNVSDPALITTYIQWVYDNIYNNPTYSSLIFKDDANQPLLIFWSESDNAHYWTTAQSLFSANVLILIRNAVNFQYSHANFEWVNYLNTGKPLSNTANWGQQYFDDFDFIMARQTENGVPANTVNVLKMGGVYPGFDDQNVPPFWNGGTNRYHLRTVDAGDTMTLTWQQQINYTPLRLFGTDSVQNAWIQIATWNDWPEGTSIEPATADTYGYTALETNRVNIALFKSAPAAFESACLRVPFDIYTRRKSSSAHSADAAVQQLLSGNCVLQSVSPSPSLTASPSPTPSLSPSVCSSPSVSNSPESSRSSPPSSSPSPTPFPSVGATVSPSSSPSQDIAVVATSSTDPMATPSSFPSVLETSSASPSPSATVAPSASGSATPTSSSSPSPSPSISMSATPSPRCPCECNVSNLQFDVQQFVRDCRARNLFSGRFEALQVFDEGEILSLCSNELLQCGEPVAPNLNTADDTFQASEVANIAEQIVPNVFVDAFF